MLLGFSMACSILKVMYVAFMNRFQGHSREFRNIMVYKEKLFAMHFNDGKLFPTYAMNFEDARLFQTCCIGSTSLI